MLLVAVKVLAEEGAKVSLEDNMILPNFLLKEVNVMGKKAVLFSSSSCPWCSRAKRYLRQNGVRVKEIRVDKDPDAAKDVKRMTGQMSVPVLLIGRAKIKGFNKQKIDRVLGLKKR